MKNKLTVITTIGLLTITQGCAYMHSVTESQMDPKTGILKQRTTARAYALLDSNASLTKFNNRSSAVDSTNRYAFSPGTYASGLNESASSTNIAAILGAMAEGVVKGMK